VPAALHAIDMTKRDEDIYRLRHLIPISVVLMMVQIVNIAIAWPDPLATALFAFTTTLIGVGCLFWSDIKIHGEGIQMYHFNRLEWSQVESAEFRKVFGLPYIFIKRTRGLSWWLPLYFRGRRTMREALEEKAPASNPVRKVLGDINGM
jgi:hypothetical protein